MKDLVFPIVSQGASIDALGLTKRELFAALCMQGLMSDPSVEWDYVEIAEHAVRSADALLAALAEEKK